MPDTYDPSTDAGRVRLNITDTDVAGEHLFSDAEIAAFLAMAGGNVDLATARALLTTAASEVLVQKRIKLLDLSTDGPGEAEALRKLADTYLSLAALAGESFSYAEMVVDPFSYREKIRKDALRGG